MRAPLGAVVLSIVSASAGVARADDDAAAGEYTEPTPPPDTDFHADAMLFADLPLAASTFRDVTSFGGGLAFRAYQGAVEAILENAAFASQDTTRSQRILYRSRLLGGYRYVHFIDFGRTYVLRADAGVELEGFANIGSNNLLANHHRLGFAAEVAGESRSVLDWGTVTLSLGAALSAAPFGDESTGAVHYVGLELIAGAAIGF